MDEPSKPKVWQVMGENFELETKFKVIDYLGAGAYGMVCAVQDSSDGGVVAIKKCKKIFQSRTLAKRTLREMRLLRQFSHENIIKLRHILQPSDLRYYTDLYLVFEIMDTDLAQIIRSPQPLKEQHTQYFIYQLLRALEYLHSKNIVHRDIKPRNILVNADCTLKVADFGLARMYNKDGPESVVAITDYVTTRWYRAPEVIVGWSRYGAAIDMWAVGCIVAELISRSPLFPGENTMKQLGLIIRIMGAPSEGFVMRSQKALFRQYMLTLMHKRATELGVLIPSASPDAIDLIRRLLDYEPARRPSASLCLTHRFILGMSNSLSPPVCSPLHIAPDEFDFELRKPNIDDLRSEINFEIAYYNQDTVQIQAVAENVSILVPKPRPVPITRVQHSNTYTGAYPYNSSSGYTHGSHASTVNGGGGGGGGGGSSAYMGSAKQGGVKQGSAVAADYTPEEVHVVERVEMDIPGTGIDADANSGTHKVHHYKPPQQFTTNAHQDVEQNIEEGKYDTAAGVTADDAPVAVQAEAAVPVPVPVPVEGEDMEIEMDVCSDNVDAPPGYPAQYTSIDTFSNHPPLCYSTNNIATSQPVYTYPTATATASASMRYDPTYPAVTIHKYSPNPNVIPVAPQHPVRTHTMSVQQQQQQQQQQHQQHQQQPQQQQQQQEDIEFTTPSAAPVHTARSATDRRPAVSKQQSTKARPPTPLVQRWQNEDSSSNSIDDNNNYNTTMSTTAATTRNNAQMLYDTYGGDININDTELQEASTLRSPTNHTNTGTAQRTTIHNNNTHPYPATKYSNTTTTAATIHKPPVRDTNIFSDSEEGDTSSEINAILHEGAEQRLGIPLYISSTDSGVDEPDRETEDINENALTRTEGNSTREYSTRSRAVSGEKGEYKQADSAYNTNTGAIHNKDTPRPTAAISANSAAKANHHYSTSLPYPSTHSTKQSSTSPIYATGIAVTNTKPSIIDTRGARASNTSSNSGTTRTRSSSHTSATQKQNRIERQKQEEAAVVSSYFTCFCEHEQEQEQYDRDSSARRYRQASTSEEESKIPEEQQQLQGLKEHLIPPGDVEEGHSSQDFDAESGYYPTHRGGSRGRSRSDPEGRRKMWDSCVIA